MRSWLLISSAVFAGCVCSELPQPRLDAVSPARVSGLVATPAALSGANFLRTATLDVRGAPPTIESRFQVLIGDLPIPEEDVHLVDSTRVEIVVPAGLASNTYDVTLIAPRGQAVTLAQALTVAPLTEVRCADGIDDDLDTLVDCADPDCSPVVCASIDGGDLDGGVDDGGVDDGGLDDGGLDDGGLDDGGLDDGGLDDGGLDDGGGDAGAGVADAGAADAGPADAGAADAGVNTPPFGCLKVSPASVAAGGVITLDATCSSDEQQPSNTLTARFHLGDDAGFSPSFQPLTPVAQVFSTPGIFTVTAEVQDNAGLRGLASRVVVITAGGASEIVVDTPIDETIANSTTSLREAVTAVNSGGVPRTIRFDGGLTVLLANSLPQLSAPGARIVGGEGVRIDFNGTSGCLALNNSNQVVVGLELYNCSSFPLMQTGTGTVVADTTVRPGPTGSLSQGVRIQGSASTFGPGNVVSGFSAGTGINISASGVLVVGSRISDCATGVSGNASANGIQVVRNVFTGNTSRGLYFVGGIIPAPIVLHNTFHANSYGLESNSGPTVLRNNLFTNNTQWAIWGGTYAVREPNGYFGNLAGNYNLTSSDAGMIEGDPRYYNAAAFDLRLRPGSVMIDQGADAGVDMNGAAPGLYFGAAPDLGAFESP